MENVNRIEEIDISRPARALSWLRLSDYALVVLCGGWALGMLTLLADSGVYASFEGFIGFLIMEALLIYSAYTGWRHVGVIDPKVWRAYRIVFPLLALTCGFTVWSSMRNVLSLEDGLTGEHKVEAMQQYSALLSAGWIGGACLLGWLSLRILRRSRIGGLHTRVDGTLAYLTGRAGSRADLATHVRRIDPARGYRLGIMGLLVLLAVTFAPTPSNKIWGELWLRNAQQVSLLGFFLLVRARRYFQIDADALLAVDKRAPILFLRSFDDDEKQEYARSDKAFLDFSLETRLSNHFSHFGPFIAIGSPKETIPQLGAARVLLSDSEWQPRVMGWMRDSQLVVMYSGKTQWVNWELRQIVDHGCATRLILMIPEIRAWRKSKRKAEIDARVAHIREVFKDTPWEEELMQFDDFMGLRAMLFCPDGSMVMIKSRSRSRDAYHLAALVAHHLLLDPAGARQPEAVAAKSSGVWWRFALGAVATVVLGFVLLVGITAMGKGKIGDRVAFKRGEVYYQAPVTREEVDRLGDYLTATGFFADDATRSVQLLREQDRYTLRFVVDTSHPVHLMTDIFFALMGKDVTRELAAAQPVEVVLADTALRPVRVVGRYGQKSFGKGELYFSKDIGLDEVDAVGQLLMREGIFTPDKTAIVYLGKGGGNYELRWVVDPAQADFDAVRRRVYQIGQYVSALALGNKAVEANLCDDNLDILTRQDALASANNSHP